MARADTTKEGITRRSLLLGGVSLLTFAGLSSRLYYLQFQKADEYRLLAEDNRIKLQILPPARGLMLDRTGATLAGRKQNFRLILDPEQARQPQAMLAKLQTLIALPQSKVKDAVRQLRGRSRAPQLLKEYLTWEELATIEFHAPRLPGIVLDVGEMRDYPLSEQASHLLGYMGAVATNDARDTPLLKLPGFKIGKGGLEKSLETTLQGKAGSQSVEVDVHGQHVRALARKEPEAGHDLRLSIHRELQQFVAERLGEESGAVIVMDAHTGEVWALASNPGFDSNRFSGGIASDYWKELNDNPRKPLLNKATHGVYPPGSTFKMMTGLAGLEAGVVNASTSFFCPGHWYLGNHKFNCWKEGGHGTVNLERALAVSCDTYFYNVAQRVGIDRLSAMAAKFGFGHITSELLPGERPATCPTPEWKKSKGWGPWQGGDTINVAIGQGYMLATPMQLAVMTARLVNGGKAVHPRFVISESVGADAVEAATLDVSQASLQLIRAGLSAVTNQVHGTAYGSRISDLGMEMGGKTGTAQVRKILQRGQDQKKLPWEWRHHAWFVGYAPVDTPRFVCSVLIEHGGGGSSAAAPVARDVLRKVQQLALGMPQPTDTNGGSV